MTTEEEDVEDFIICWYQEKVNDAAKRKFGIKKSALLELSQTIDNEMLCFTSKYPKEAPRFIMASVIANTILNISKSSFLEVYDNSNRELINIIQDDLSCDLYLNFLLGENSKYIMEHYEDINKAFRVVKQGQLVNQIGIDVLMLLSKILISLAESKKPFHKKIFNLKLIIGTNRNK